MIRPCFLVIDREYSGSISTRKLVIETAKFNVITAYSGKEAIETLQRFPAVSGAVLDAGVKDVPCIDLIATLKKIVPGILVIAVGTPGEADCRNADRYLASFEPVRLLEILKALEPEKTAEIEHQEGRLSDAGF